MNRYDFPKVDLHLHLDGSVNPKSAYEMAKERKLLIADASFEQFRKGMVLEEEIESLYDYLKKFEVPTVILQDTEALERVSFELVLRLAGLGLCYAEVRFAPQLHTKKGCTQREIVESVLRGANRAMQQRTTIKVGILLCTMTLMTVEQNEKENLETVELAKEYLGHGVVGLDMAGAEGIVPLIKRELLFSRAKELDIPFTIHAGEVECAENVKTAIEFGARRIGHGHHCIDDANVLRLVLETKTPLEICITSNIQCKNQPSYEAHPIKSLYEMGAAVTMNTDNMVLSNVTLDSEYAIAQKVYGFTRLDLITLNENSIRASFLSEEEKADYLNKMKSYR
ncbi:MAG: adenosine deaminase [Anaerovorax sp.]|nr:adenosine deaminase [Anaerovorax sp.]